MSELSVKESSLHGKETSQHTPPSPDVEQGDVGILVHAAPLARKLKGRHMQMIAIGMSSSALSSRLNPKLCYRRCNWSRFVRWVWQCIGNWRTWEFGESLATLSIVINDAELC